jgi:hypothetical protein
MKLPAEKKPKRKMQNVSFNSLDDFFEFLPENELRLVNSLREIVLGCIPGCQEKLAYNVPYYRRFANICFIWPPAVKWGNSTQTGVRLGFTNGYLLQDELNYLDKGDRKQVYWKDFFNLDEVDVPLLKAYLFNAVEIDEEKARLKKQLRIKGKNQQK